jgi:hypothetical protein
VVKKIFVASQHISLVRFSAPFDNWPTMKRTAPALICLMTFALMITQVPNASAKRPPKAKPRPSFTPPPTPTPAPAPSVDLAKFVSTNSDKIFGAYSPQVPMPKAEVAQLKASFSERFGKAGLADRDQYKYAMAVCDGLTQVMAEKATVQPAAWTQRSAQLKTWIDQLMAQEKAAESAATAPSPAH